MLRFEWIKLENTLKERDWINALQVALIARSVNVMDSLANLPTELINWVVLVN